MPHSRRKRSLPPTPPSTEDSPQQKRQKTESLYHVYTDLGPQLRLTKQALHVLDEHNKALPSRASDADCKRCPLPPTPPLAPAEILRHVKNPSVGLRRFAHQGGPDLGDIYQDARISSTMASKRKNDSAADGSFYESTSRPTKSNKTGPYDANFEFRMKQFGIVTPTHEPLDGEPPVDEAANEADVVAHIERRRDDVISEEDIKFVRRAMGNSTNEAGLRDDVLPKLEVTRVHSHRAERGTEHLFSGLTPIVPDEQVAQAKPDVYYGARPESILPHVRIALHRHIMPAANEDAPAAPNFFIAIKGSEGSYGCAKRQALYYAALGARGIRSLETFRRPNLPFDGNIHAISVVLDSRGIDIYGTYILNRNQGSSPITYASTLLGEYPMQKNGCLAGIHAFRNACELARRIRNDAITTANTAPPMQVQVLVPVAPRPNLGSQQQQQNLRGDMQQSQRGRGAGPPFPNTSSMTLRSVDVNHGGGDGGRGEGDGRRGRGGRGGRGRGRGV